MNSTFPTVKYQRNTNFAVKSYRVSTVSGYTYDMATYLVKDRTHPTVDESNSSVTSPKGQGHGH